MPKFNSSIDYQSIKDENNFANQNKADSITFDSTIKGKDKSCSKQNNSDKKTLMSLTK